MQEEERRITPAEQPNTALAPQRRPDDWQALGEAFEAMGKAGLALTIGFTVAATVCKLAQQGRLKLPDLLSFLQPAEGEPPRRQEGSQ
ncbi:MAG: hypothetical protein AB1758_02700 [Candidatus Eremiobacterota bacterium]